MCWEDIRSSKNPAARVKRPLHIVSTFIPLVNLALISAHMHMFQRISVAVTPIDGE